MIQYDSFRHAETQQIFDWIRAGESALVIGVSGVGKSNLLNHICSSNIKRKYLEDVAPYTIIIRVDFHYLPDLNDRSIYSLILEQLEFVENQVDLPSASHDVFEKIRQHHEALLQSKDDNLKVQRYFKLAIQTLMADAKVKLVFLFDQFEQVYRDANPHLFANFRGLRETYKYRLSYIIFSRELLTNLVEMDMFREEFYELVVANITRIQLHSESDAIYALERIAQRRGKKLPHLTNQALFKLTGGHAGLLHMTSLVVLQNDLENQSEETLFDYDLLAHSSIRHECEKIWLSLSIPEKHLLSNIAWDRDIPHDKALIGTLLLKGILVNDKKLGLFSSIFCRYVHEQDAVWEKPIHFDESSRQVWVLGKLRPAFTKRELYLFRYLWQHKDEVVLKDELIEAGWPEAKGGVSDVALVAAISRLRKKIEPDTAVAEPRFLVNARGQGYCLRTE